MHVDCHQVKTCFSHPTEVFRQQNILTSSSIHRKRKAIRQKMRKEILKKRNIGMRNLAAVSSSVVSASLTLVVQGNKSFGGYSRVIKSGVLPSSEAHSIISFFLSQHPS